MVDGIARSRAENGAVRPARHKFIACGNGPSRVNGKLPARGSHPR